MNPNNNRPIWMQREGRFQLSLWSNADESGTQKERYSFCIQHGYFKDGAWHNRRIWCNVMDLIKLSACLKSFHAMVARKDRVDIFCSKSEPVEPVAFFREKRQALKDRSDSTGKTADDPVPVRVLEVIEHIKRCMASLPELGVWWNRQDVEMDMDAVLMSYGLRSQDIGPDERDYLREQLIILADLERNGGLLSGPQSLMGQTFVPEVTG